MYQYQVGLNQLIACCRNKKYYDDLNTSHCSRVCRAGEFVLTSFFIAVQTFVYLSELAGSGFVYTR